MPYPAAPEATFSKVYALMRTPPRLFSAKPGKRGAAIRPFEPFPEALPLESGYYTFVIDAVGRLYVERGNRSSHAGMVEGRPVGAAGHLRITRAGKVGMVYCTSLDYGISIPDGRHPTVGFLIDAFERHQAFEVSPLAFFRFARNRFESFCVATDGGPVDDPSAREVALSEEGQGVVAGPGFTQAQRDAFLRYVPARPPRLYGMQRDQDPIDLDSDEVFAFGPQKPPLGPDDDPPTSGRKAFILDEQGRLVIGYGHHILSGGNPVGAAGQIYVNDFFDIDQINLNFSGHYRPPLSAAYARYTYRSLCSHPLLRFDPACRITARRNFGMGSSLALVEFRAADLLADDEALEALLGEFDESGDDDTELQVDDVDEA